MTANPVLSMTTMGDKSESESGISLEKVESGMTVKFWISGNDLK